MADGSGVGRAMKHDGTYFVFIQEIIFMIFETQNDLQYRGRGASATDFDESADRNG
jgi:hypothetical protein